MGSVHGEWTRAKAIPKTPVLPHRRADGKNDHKQADATVAFQARNDHRSFYVLSYWHIVYLIYILATPG